MPELISSNILSVEKKFEGSLPAFLAAFARRQELSEKDVEEIRRIIER